MNSIEILEGNKLIAEFLNQKLPSNSDFDIYLYHSSWDWLIPVVEKIESLTPIEGADKIELAKVRGWNVVVQKGLYEEGDYVVDEW